MTQHVRRTRFYRQVKLTTRANSVQPRPAICVWLLFAARGADLLAIAVGGLCLMFAAVGIAGPPVSFDRGIWLEHLVAAVDRRVAAGVIWLNAYPTMFGLILAIFCVCPTSASLLRFTCAIAARSIFAATAWQLVDLSKSNCLFGEPSRKNLMPLRGGLSIVR